MKYEHVEKPRPDELTPDRPIDRRRTRWVFFRIVEILAVILSFLAGSEIARFISAKVTMDVLVEITARFGAGAGHRVSSLVALIVAQLRIIAVIVAGLFIICHLIAWIFRSVRRGWRRRRGHRRPPHHHGGQGPHGEDPYHGEQPPQAQQLPHDEDPYHGEQPPQAQQLPRPGQPLQNQPPQNPGPVRSQMPAGLPENWKFSSEDKIKKAD